MKDDEEQGVLREGGVLEMALPHRALDSRGADRQERCERGPIADCSKLFGDEEAQ